MKNLSKNWILQYVDIVLIACFAGKNVEKM